MERIGYASIAVFGSLRRLTIGRLVVDGMLLEIAVCEPGRAARSPAVLLQNWTIPGDTSTIQSVGRRHASPD